MGSSNALRELFSIKAIFRSQGSLVSQGNDFKGVISKVPRGNSFCEACIIDIKKRPRGHLKDPIRLRMAQTRPFSHL